MCGDCFLNLLQLTKAGKTSVVTNRAFCGKCLTALNHWTSIIYKTHLHRRFPYLNHQVLRELIPLIEQEVKSRPGAAEGPTGSSARADQTWPSSSSEEEPSLHSTVAAHGEQNTNLSPSSSRGLKKHASSTTSSDSGCEGGQVSCASMPSSPQEEEETRASQHLRQQHSQLYSSREDILGPVRPFRDHNNNWYTPAVAPPMGRPMGPYNMPPTNWAHHDALLSWQARQKAEYDYRLSAQRRRPIAPYPQIPSWNQVTASVAVTPMQPLDPTQQPIVTVHKLPVQPVAPVSATNQLTGRPQAKAVPKPIPPAMDYTPLGTCSQCHEMHTNQLQCGGSPTAVATCQPFSYFSKPAAAGSTQRAGAPVLSAFNYSTIDPALWAALKLPKDGAMTTTASGTAVPSQPLDLSAQERPDTPLPAVTLPSKAGPLLAKTLAGETSRQQAESGSNLTEHDWPHPGETAQQQVAGQKEPDKENKQKDQQEMFLLETAEEDTTSEEETLIVDISSEEEISVVTGSTTDVNTDAEPTTTDGSITMPTTTDDDMTDNEARAERILKRGRKKNSSCDHDFEVAYKRRDKKNKK